MWYSSKTWTLPILSLVPTKVNGTIPCVNKTQKHNTHVSMGVMRKVSTTFVWSKTIKKINFWHWISTLQQFYQKELRHGSSRLTSCRGCLLSLSPSILTLTTPDLSTISWITLPFLPITLPGDREQVKVEKVTFNNETELQVKKTFMD